MAWITDYDSWVGTGQCTTACNVFSSLTVKGLIHSVTPWEMQEKMIFGFSNKIQTPRQ